MRRTASSPRVAVVLLLCSSLKLLVFYIGNILVDKNTLCNNCFLTGFRLYSEFSSNMDSVFFHALCLITSFKKMYMNITCNFKSEQPVPVQPSGWAFEGIRTPHSV
jgi:hypothetical protein